MLHGSRGPGAREGGLGRVCGPVLLVGLVACDPGSVPATAGHTVTDSAGIEIVTSTASAWGEGEGWRIASEPAVVIGAVEGDERYLLSNVTAVRRFEDGRIAVLDGGSSRVRIYDAEGRHLADFGGEGDGPAEFQSPQHLRLLGDTVVVYDALRPALVRFTAEGRHLDRVPLVTSEGRDDLIFGFSFGWLSNAEGVLATDPVERTWLEPGIQREEMTVWRYDMHSGALDSIVHLATDQIRVRVTESGQMGWNIVIFGRTTFYAAAGDRLFTAPTDHYSISVRDRTGRVERIIRRPTASRPVTDEDRASFFRQSLRGRMSEEEIERRIAVAEVPLAETMPAHHMIVADAAGNLWVEELDDVGIDQGSFSVFDADGVWLGRIELPPGLPPFRSRPNLASQMEIGPDYLLGVWVDELGVEQVRLYRIEKDR